MKRAIRDIAWLELLLAASVVALIAQLGWPAFHAWLNRPQAGRQVAQRFEGMNYWLYLTREYGQSRKKGEGRKVTATKAGEDRAICCHK